tara:strand:- start:381 stop:557 length:177 start_codon:yes stop_codon:yes gene_type:complete
MDINEIKDELKDIEKKYGTDKLNSILKSENSDEFDGGYYFVLKQVLKYLKEENDAKLV